MAGTKKTPVQKGGEALGKIAPQPQATPGGATPGNAPASLAPVSSAGVNSVVKDLNLDPNYLASLRKQGSSGGAKPYVPRATITNITDAAVLASKAFKNLGLDREPTIAEVNTIAKALNAVERKNPKQRITNAQGAYEFTGGVNPAEVVNQLLTGEIKSKAIKNLNLEPELTKATQGAELIQKQKLDTAAKNLLNTAMANGLTLSQSQIENYKSRLAAGETMDALQQDIRKIASLGMPEQVKSLLGTGSNLEDVYSPYRQTMASVLEIPYDQIDINDPILRSAISPTGEMPIYDFQRQLRKDPRWQYTNNARKEVSTAVTQVLKDFGFMG